MRSFCRESGEEYRALGETVNEVTVQEEEDVSSRCAMACDGPGGKDCGVNMSYRQEDC